MKDITPRPQREAQSCFFLASVLVYYERDESQKQRHLNVLFDAPGPNLPKSALNSIQQAAMRRIGVENNVTPDMVRDVVFLNIVLLGAMTAKQFHGEDKPHIEDAQVLN